MQISHSSYDWHSCASCVNLFVTLKNKHHIQLNFMLIVQVSLMQMLMYLLNILKKCKTCYVKGKSENCSVLAGLSMAEKNDIVITWSSFSTTHFSVTEAHLKTCIKMFYNRVRRMLRHCLHIHVCV